MTLADVLFWSGPVGFAAFWGSEVLINRLGGGQRLQPVRGWTLVGVVYYLLGFYIGIAVPFVLPPAWLDDHRLLDLRSLGFWGVPVAFLAVSFVAYWFHRAEHRFEVMWRGFHQLHHSIERVDMPGWATAHPTELFAYPALYSLVSTLVLGVEPMAAAVATTVLTTFTMFQHWSVRTPYWLGFVILRPEQHCQHHERDVHARNYGSDIALWDQVFGSFANTRRFEGKVGFGQSSIRAMPRMLVFADVNVSRSPNQ